MNVRWNIRQKLNAVLTLCGLLFIGISAPVISYFSFAAYENDARLQQARLVGAVTTSAAIATFVANEEIANEVLGGLLQDDEILAVELQSKDGFVMRRYSDGSATTALNDAAATVYPLYSPVEPEKRIGEIRVWRNAPLIAKRAQEIVHNDVVLLAFMSFILALVSMLAVNILVGSPLRRLAEQVSDAKPGSVKKISVGKLHKQDEIGLVTRSVNDFLDVTHKAFEKERSLREQIETMNQHFSNIFSNSHVGIMVVDEKGLLLHHNPVLFDRIVKLDETRFSALSHTDIFSTMFADSEVVWDLVDMARTTHETVEGDLPLAAAWHDDCWVHCILNVNRDPHSGEEVIECVLYDVSRRVHEAEAARQLAELDALTGLYNRRGCDNYLKQRFRRPDAKNKLVAMLIDLDGFKPVNDKYGHGAGDDVLQVIGRRLQAQVRANIDLVGRIGGDEFVVFLKMAKDKRDQIEQVAGKIVQSLAEPIDLGQGHQVQIGASIGIAFGADYEEIEDLMHAADEAMYRVKTKGKNDFAFME